MGLRNVNLKTRQSMRDNHGYEKQYKNNLGMGVTWVSTIDSKTFWVEKTLLSVNGESPSVYHSLETDREVDKDFWLVFGITVLPLWCVTVM